MYLTLKTPLYYLQTCLVQSTTYIKHFYKTTDIGTHIQNYINHSIDILNYQNYSYIIMINH